MGFWGLACGTVQAHRQAIAAAAPAGALKPAWRPLRPPYPIACRLRALSLEASSYSELRASLEAAHNRSAELSQACLLCTCASGLAAHASAEWPGLGPLLAAAVSFHLAGCTRVPHLARLTAAPTVHCPAGAGAQRWLAAGDPAAGGGAAVGAR